MRTNGQILRLALGMVVALCGCSERRTDERPSPQNVQTGAVHAAASQRVGPPRKRLPEPLRAIRAWAARHAADFNERLEDKSGKGDVAGLLRMSKSVQNSDDLGKRMAMVEALGWNVADERAAEELLVYACDANEEVARTAFNFVRNALDVIAESPAKAKLVCGLAKLCEDDADRRDVLSAFESMKTSLAVDELVELCQSPVRGLAKAAEEEYAFVTGEKFLGSKHARIVAERHRKRELHDEARAAKMEAEEQEP